MTNFANIASAQIVGRPAFLAPQCLVQPEVTSGLVVPATFAQDLRSLAAVTADEDHDARRAQAAMVLASTYGLPYQQNDKPFAFAGGYAIVPVHGMLINRFPWSYSFATGYNFIRDQVLLAMDDPEVDGIILDVNSYGGTVAGAQETADIIYMASRRNGGKPICAMVDASCFSAAYYVASQADYIAVTPSGMAGSVGVLWMHFDYSKLLSDVGVSVTMVYAGAHKVDGNPYEPLSDEVRAAFQAQIDDAYTSFVDTVVRGRGMSEESVRGTEARTYMAAEAVALGLVDSVLTPSAALDAFFNASDSTDETDDPGNEKDQMMKTQNNSPAAGAGPEVISADARAAERQRIAAIAGHEAAKGRSQLANHLAMNTDLDVEAAAAILAAAPVEQAAPAPAPAAAAAETPSNFFRAAMDNTPNPNIPAGGAGSGASAGPSNDDNVPPAQRILRAQASLSGKSLTANYQVDRSRLKHPRNVAG